MSGFKDSQGIIGRPVRAPISEAKFSADSTSRSLSQSSRDNKLTRHIQVLIRPDNYLVLDITQIINDGKIKISKTVALRLAQWIIYNYGDHDARVQSEDSNTQETNLAGTSEGDSRVPSSQTKIERETPDGGYGS